MVRTALVVGVSALVLFACADGPQSPPAASPVDPPPAAPTAVVADPSTPPPASPTASTPTPPALAMDAGAVALSTTDAAAPIPDEGVDPRFLACSVDSDCVSVERVGCCHNGRHVGVAASQKDAYLKSFTCPERHPKCPQYRLKDDGRVGACDGTTHLCGLK